MAAATSSNHPAVVGPLGLRPLPHTGSHWPFRRTSGLPWPGEVLLARRTALEKRGVPAPGEEGRKNRVCF